MSQRATSSAGGLFTDDSSICRNTVGDPWAILGKIHVDYVANTANRTLGYIKRNIRQVPQSLKLTFHRSVDCSGLEYAVLLWDLGTVILAQAITAI